MGTPRYEKYSSMGSFANAKSSSIFCGWVNKLGPPSKQYPFPVKKLILPPAWLFFSYTVTVNPCAASLMADANPATPAPIIMAVGACNIV